MAFFEDNSISHSVTTVAVFRAWAKMIHKALEEVGLVNTADTGQINLETVELPAISTFAGYEIWRFADARQGAEPIYLRLEYGRGANEVRPNLRYAFGTGSNGAGTLTNSSAQVALTATGTSEGNGYIYACNLDGAFGLISCAKTNEAGNSTANFMGFQLERLKTAEFATINGFAVSTGTALASFTVWVEGSWQTGEFNTTAGSATYGGLTIPTLKYLTGPVISAPFRAILGGKSGVIGSLDTGKINQHGTERKYFRLPVSKEVAFPGGATGSTAVGHNILMIHE